MKKAPFIGIFGLVCAISLAVAGCGSSAPVSLSSDKPVVVVNGTEITASQIDRKINSLKIENHIETDEDWSKFLASKNLTDEQVKQKVIDSLILSSLVRQEAKKRDLTVDHVALEKKIDAVRANYADTTAWERALSLNGYDEASYREAVELSLLMQELRDAVIKNANPTPKQVEEYCKAVAPRLKGKKSSHILFKLSDKDLAQVVLDKIRKGADFGEMVREYSIDDASKRDGGNIGWDCVVRLVPEYQKALNKLHRGEVSELVKTKYGYHIIKCTEVFNPFKIKNLTSESIPKDLREHVLSTFKRELSDQEFENYLAHLEKTASIKYLDGESGVSGEALAEASPQLNPDIASASAPVHPADTKGAAGSGKNASKSPEAASKQEPAATDLKVMPAAASEDANPQAAAVQEGPHVSDKVGHNQDGLATESELDTTQSEFEASAARMVIERAKDHSKKYLEEREK